MNIDPMAEYERRQQSKLAEETAKELKDLAKTLQAILTRNPDKVMEIELTPRAYKPIISALLRGAHYADAERERLESKDQVSSLTSSESDNLGATESMIPEHFLQSELRAPQNDIVGPQPDLRIIDERDALDKPVV